MLSDHEQAEAYAFISDALEELESLLTAVEAGFLDKDWDIVEKMGNQLKSAKDILEP